MEYNYRVWTRPFLYSISVWQGSKELDNYKNSSFQDTTTFF